MSDASLCGAWVAIGGYYERCARDVEHEGLCMPLRSAVMDQAESLERRAQAIYDAVRVADAFSRWPYEGPNERPAVIYEGPFPDRGTLQS